MDTSAVLTNRYNPLDYVVTESDIDQFATCIVDTDIQASPFWKDAEKLLLIATISYLKKYSPKEEQTLVGVDSCLVSFANAHEGELPVFKEEASYKKFADTVAADTQRSVALKCQDALGKFYT